MLKGIDMTRELFTDADLTHRWVTEHRLPVVQTIWPRSSYLVALTLPSAEDFENKFSLVGKPNDDDASVVASYLEYLIQKQQYRGSYLNKMRAEALDEDHGFNTITIFTRKDGTWAYQRTSWTSGASPRTDSDAPCNSVVELLDYIEKNAFIGQGVDSWADWKVKHSIS